MPEFKIEDENRKKRVRDEFDESEADAPDSKHARVDSVTSDVNSEDSGVSSLEAQRIQDDLLNLINDAYPDPAIEDLESVIKSFEEEILVPEQQPSVVMSVSGDSRPELGFLLEASDDELGLPPNFSAGEEQKIESGDLNMSGLKAPDLDGMALGFENEMPSCKSFNFGIGGDVNVVNDFITLDDGLFESYELGDISESAWPPESLSAS